MNQDRKSTGGPHQSQHVGLLGLIGFGRVPAHAGALLERKIARSRLALGIERAWPRLWLPAGAVGVFVLVSLAGLWPMLSPLLHKVVLAGFGIALLASLVPLARMPWPDREESLRRLERQSGVPHRPASAYEDRLSDAVRSAPAERIWATHRARIAKLIARLGVKAPEPRVERHDPFAFRTLLLLALGLGFVVAGSSTFDRLGSAFRITGGQSGESVRLDAWVAPPPYTGKLPLMLASGAERLGGEEQQARLIEVPEGTQLVVRAAGPGHLDFKVRLVAEDETVTDFARTAEADPKAGEARSEVSEWRTVLTKSVTVRVLAGATERYSWQLSVTDDLPPTIELTKPPTASPRGAMSLSFRASDDYGVQSAEAAFDLIDPKLKIEELKGSDGVIVGALAVAPIVPLKLAKPGKEKNKEARTPLDLSAHPWAGLKVALTLSAKDHAGQIGTSRVHEMIMPARKFQKPLAKALVEQRRKLALQPARYGEVIRALQALTIAPERYIDDASTYLGIRTVYWRLANPPSAAGMQSAVDQLWRIALRIEDGNLSEAERALKEAQDKLMQALQDGASEEEVQRLMNELRQALNTFLNALAAQAAQNPNNQQGESQRPDRMMSQRDLNEILKQIEELAKSGATDQAQQMLSELRDMLDRMQAGRQDGQGQQGQQMMQMMEQFGNLITGQRRLLDETFGAQRGGKQPGRGQQGNGERQKVPGQGQQGGEGQEEREWGANGLGQRQGELRQQLDELMRQLQGLGDNAQDQLGSARRAMENAEGALQDGDLESATRQQSRALDDLRQGAQAMTEQMLGSNQGQSSSRNSGDGDRDPLGRPLGNGDDVLPNARSRGLGEDDLARAKEILKELRKRLGEATRPELELDYLERLLKKQ